MEVNLVRRKRRGGRSVVERVGSVRGGDIRGMRWSCFCGEAAEPERWKPCEGQESVDS
jgi:hypothetical protein